MLGCREISDVWSREYVRAKKATARLYPPLAYNVRYGSLEICYSDCQVSLWNCSFRYCFLDLGYN
jgi:hypothetical protein